MNDKAQSISKRKLVKTVVEALPFPDNGQYFVWDSDLKGFGVRVTPGSKSYVAQDRVNGKTSRVTIGSHGKFTAEQARSEAKKLLGEMEKGKNLNDEKRLARARSITLEEVWKEYREVKTLRPTTVEVYDGALRRCFPDWSRRPITSITKDMIEKRCRDIKDTKKFAGSGPSTARQAMMVLGSLLNYASIICEDREGRSLIPENPVLRLRQKNIWPEIKRRQTVIKKHQIKPWFKAVNDLGNTTIRDCLLLLLFTGLRKNEAAKLRWADVDLDGRVIELEDEFTKNHQAHHIPMSDFVYELLKRRFEIKKADAVYVFPGHGKRVGHLVEMKATTKVVIENSGVRFMVHDLRRSFLTIAEGLDISHYALKRLVNHKTKADVTSGYIAADVERLREPVQKIANYILEQVGSELTKPTKPIMPVREKAVRLTDDHARLVAIK
jgi:integrase